MEKNADGDPRGSTSYDIVSAVAAKEDRELLDLPPLNDAIDPEALETVATADETRIAFTYCSHRIVVRDGEIRVDP